MDLVDQEKRSRMMAGIRGGDTIPELLVRRGLFARGFRHRLGTNYLYKGRRLPGRPDLVYPRHQSVIQVNGCFWHVHGCHMFKWPATREEFWRDKLSGNAARDAWNRSRLESEGWRVLTIWECAIKGKERLPMNEVLQTAANWILYDSQSAEIIGRSSQ